MQWLQGILIKHLCYFAADHTVCCRGSTIVVTSMSHLDHEGHNCCFRIYNWHPSNGLSFWSLHNPAPESKHSRFLWSTQTHTHPFNGPFPGLPRWAVTRKVKPIWILLKQETVSSSGSGISWALCKSAPRSRQITMPVPHHSVFYRPDALRATQPTASKHWRHKIFLWSMRWLCGLIRALDLWLKSCRFKSWRWHFQDTPLGRLFKDMPLSPSCIAWYQSKGGDSLWLGR